MGREKAIPIKQWTTTIFLIKQLFKLRLASAFLVLRLFLKVFKKLAQKKFYCKGSILCDSLLSENVKVLIKRGNVIIKMEKNNVMPLYCKNIIIFFACYLLPSVLVAVSASTGSST